MSRFEELTKLLRGLDRKEAIKVLEKELGHSTDELVTAGNLAENEYDDLANIKRQLQTDENAIQVNPEIKKEAWGFEKEPIPEVDDAENTRRHMEWLKDNRPEEAARLGAEMRAGMEATNPVDQPIKVVNNDEFSKLKEKLKTNTSTGTGTGSIKGIIPSGISGAVSSLPFMKGDTNPLHTAADVYDKFETGRKDLAGKLANQLTMMPNKQASEAEKSLMGAVTNPLNFVGGVGAVDAAMTLPEAIPDGTFSKLRKALGSK